MSTDLGETEEGIILAAAVAGDKKPVPDANTSEECQSCGAKVEHIYCGNCGQKNDDLRRSLWRLIGESLGGIFAFESRLWRTWGVLLLKPGEVAHAYANGARTIYSPPIRVYLAVSFMFFGFLAITETNLFALSIQPKAEVEATDLKKVEDIASESIVSEGIVSESSKSLLDNYNIRPLFFQSQKTFERLSDDTVTEDFLKTIQTDNKSTNPNIDPNIEPSIEPNIDTNKDISAQEEPLEAFQIFLKSPKKFNAAFNTWLPRVMFFMVPFAMIIGAIFIRGPTALLYDHLIHAMYIHAVFFMTLLFAVILAKILPGSFVAKALVIMFMVYLPLSLKRMFNRGWFKTIMTTIIVSALYSIFLLSAILLISIFSIANLAA